MPLCHYRPYRLSFDVLPVEDGTPIESLFDRMADKLPGPGADALGQLMPDQSGNVALYEVHYRPRRVRLFCLVPEHKTAESIIAELQAAFLEIGWTIEGAP